MQAKIDQRTKKRIQCDQSEPMTAGYNICYDVDARYQVTACGGIGNIHQLAEKSGLVDEINACIELLKRHLLYHESDHILNIAYNCLAGGSCLQYVDLFRNNKAWLNALDPQIITDSTTAGGFLRSFAEPDISEFMDVKNTVRKNIWQKQQGSFFREAIINIDGTICATDGECKPGMDISWAIGVSSTGRYVAQHPLSNWALMTIASLAWFRLLLSYPPVGLSVARMKFKRFVITFICIFCLIVRTGHRICYRIAGDNDKRAHVINLFETIKSFRGT